MRKKFLLIGILLSLTVRIYLILNGSEVADVHSLKEMGGTTLSGMNPYLTLNYNSYPPLALYLEVITLKFSSFLNIPFYILIKVLPNLADFLTAAVLYKFFTKKGIPNTSIYIWCLIFLLNPISIIISAAHGQIDAITSFFVTLSIFFLTFYSTKFYIFLSALLLGIAIAVKPNPLILLPLFLSFRKTDLKTAITFSLITIVSVIILFLPFLQDNPNYVLEKIFSYSGSNDFGISAILRGIYYQKTHDYNLIISKEVLQYSKEFFLTGFFILVLIYNRQGKLIKASLSTYLLFLACYLGISAQYLSWILPLAILEKDLVIIPYSLSGLISLLGFYLFINPRILLAQFSNIPPYQSQFMLVYVLGNLVLWIVIIVWLIKLLIPQSLST